MMNRILSVMVVTVAMFALVGLPLMAQDEKVHQATVDKAGEGKITLTFKGDDSKHTHDVAKDAKITLDDKKAKLEDLKEGYPVRATMDEKFVITKIDAKSKTK